MKAYSLDLRERVVRAMQSGQPISVVARAFSVSRATAQRWARRVAAAEPLGPSPHLGRRRTIGPAAEAALEAQLRAHPDALLTEHCQLWEESQGVRLRKSAMWAAIRRLRWTRKKGRWQPPSRTPTPGLPGALPTPPPRLLSSSSSTRPTPPGRWPGATPAPRIGNGRSGGCPA